MSNLAKHWFGNRLKSGPEGGCCPPAYQPLGCSATEGCFLCPSSRSDSQALKTKTDFQLLKHVSQRSPQNNDTLRAGKETTHNLHPCISPAGSLSSGSHCLNVTFHFAWGSWIPGRIWVSSCSEHKTARMPGQPYRCRSLCLSIPTIR